MLDSFRSATEILSGQKYPTFSCLGPILADLREKIVDKSQDPAILKSAKCAMRTDLSERYQDTDVVQLMNKAAFFDPRFKTLHIYLQIQ